MFRITEKELAELQQNDECYIGKSMAEIFHYSLREYIESHKSHDDFVAYVQKSAQYFLNRTYRDMQLVIFPDSSFLKMKLYRWDDEPDEKSYILQVQFGRYKDADISYLYDSSIDDFKL